AGRNRSQDRGRQNRLIAALSGSVVCRRTIWDGRTSPITLRTAFNTRLLTSHSSTAFLAGFECRSEGASVQQPGSRGSVLSGNVEGIFITDAAGQPMSSLEEAAATAGRGLEGDRYANRVGHYSETP